MEPFRLLVTRRLRRPPADYATRELHVEAIPFIRTEPLPLAAAAEAAALLERPATVVLTSARAVEALQDFARETGRQAPPPWKAFCIAGPTAEAFRNWTGAGALLGLAPQAEVLAALIRAWPEELPTLHFFCGNRRRDTLPQALSEAGIPFIAHTVYTTVATPRTLPAPYDGYAFFSPSAVESFFSVNCLPPEACCFSVGDTTTAALQERTEAPVWTAAFPAEEEVLRLAAAWAGNRASARKEDPASAGRPPDENGTEQPKKPAPNQNVYEQPDKGPARE